MILPPLLLGATKETVTSNGLGLGLSMDKVTLESDIGTLGVVTLLVLLAILVP